MDQPNYDFTWLYTTLSAAGSSLVTWVFTRRKQNAEAKTAEQQAAQSELDNVEKAIGIWRGIASDLEGKFNALQLQVIELQKTTIRLELENEMLTRKNEELQREIEELRKQP